MTKIIRRAALITAALTAGVAFAWAALIAAYAIAHVLTGAGRRGRGL